LGIVNSAQQLGAGLGLSVLSSIAAARTSAILAQAHGNPTAEPGALVLGFQRGFVTGGIILLAGAVVAVLATRHSDGLQVPASGRSATGDQLHAVTADGPACDGNRGGGQAPRGR
jgi:hypothetical protein